MAEEKKAQHKSKAGLIALSEVQYNGEVVLNHGDDVTDAKVKELGADLMNELYDSGVVVEKAALPEYWKDRPEGNSDTVGFRVPDLSEMKATQDRQAAQESSSGQATEING